MTSEIQFGELFQRSFAKKHLLAGRSFPEVDIMASICSLASGLANVVFEVSRRLVLSGPARIAQVYSTILSKNEVLSVPVLAAKTVS